MGTIEIEKSFHGVSYVISYEVQESAFLLRLETENSLRNWFGKFSSSYVENVTSKTGNFKRFEVFAKMLAQALSAPTKSLFTDILTSQDLHLLKARKGSSRTKCSMHGISPDSDKRYLILTYIAAFDKVHYPLSIPVCENPTVEMLRRTISRLHSKLNNRKFGNNPKFLKFQEVDALRQKLAKLETENAVLISERDSLAETVRAFRRRGSDFSPLEEGEVDERTHILKEKLTTLERIHKESNHSHQRLQSRRKKELEKAMEEIEKLRRSNRLLRSKLRKNSSVVSMTTRKSARNERSKSASLKRRSRSGPSRRNSITSRKGSTETIRTMRVGKARNKSCKSSLTQKNKAFNLYRHKSDSPGRAIKSRGSSKKRSSQARKNVKRREYSGYNSTDSSISYRTRISETSSTSESPRHFPRLGKAYGSRGCKSHTFGGSFLSKSRNSDIQESFTGNSKEKFSGNSFNHENLSASDLNSSVKLESKADLSDIDDRLTALQSFLKEARSKTFR